MIEDLSDKARAYGELFDEGLDKQIALIGFIVLNKISHFKSLVEHEKTVYPRYFINVEIHSRYTNFLLIRLILKNYSKLKAEIGTLQVLDIFDETKEIKLWEYAGNFIEKDYEAFPLIINYVSKHVHTIESVAILNFMSKHFPGSEDTKEIALNILEKDHFNLSTIAAEILTEQYKNDAEVYNAITKTPIGYMDVGKVVYLCKSHPESSILDVIFQQTNSRKYNIQIQNYVRALKITIEQILESLNKLFNQLLLFRKERRNLLPSLLNRVEKDEKLQEALLHELLANNNTVAKKLFLYKIVSKSKIINLDELNTWKKNESNNESQQKCLNISYDIMENSTALYVNVINED